MRSAIANRLRGLVAVAALLPLATTAADIVKDMPKAGDLPRGRTVYVDDGKCPPGELKEVTGGSQDKSLPRTVRCVKRPE